MQNWRDYVGYQPISLTDKDPENTRIGLFYLTSIKNEDNRPAFQILKEYFDLSEVVLTDEEVGNKVEELLLSFPKAKVEGTGNSLAVTLEKLKIGVASSSRRGPANTNYNNTWFYKGDNAVDAPVIVCGHEDKYYIFTHPNFKQYGFNVI